MVQWTLIIRIKKGYDILTSLRSNKVASIPQVPARRIEDDRNPLGAGKQPNG